MRIEDVLLKSNPGLAEFMKAADRSDRNTQDLFGGNQASIFNSPTPVNGYTDKNGRTVKPHTASHQHKVVLVIDKKLAHDFSAGAMPAAQPSASRATGNQSLENKMDAIAPARKLSNGMELALLPAMSKDGDHPVVHISINGRVVSTSMAADGPDSVYNLLPSTKDAPEHVAGITTFWDKVQREGGKGVDDKAFRIGLTKEEVAAIRAYLAPGFARHADARAKRSIERAKEIAYDNLYNEGYSDGYNPHRTPQDDGDRTPWQKGDDQNT